MGSNPTRYSMKKIFGLIAIPVMLVAYWWVNAWQDDEVDL